MKKNVKIAKQLVKLAKNLIDENIFNVGDYVDWKEINMELTKKEDCNANNTWNNRSGKIVEVNKRNKTYKILYKIGRG